MAKAVKTSKITVPVTSWTFRLEDCVLRFHKGININTYGVTEDIEKLFASRGYGIFLRMEEDSQESSEPSTGPSENQRIFIFEREDQTGNSHYELKNGQTFVFPVQTAARITD